MVLFQVVLDPTKILGVEFFNFLLPWILTFVISYALLNKLKLFGRDDNINGKISLAISLVFAFFVTASAGPQMAAFFSKFFGNATVYLVGVLVLAMLLSFVSDKGIGAIPGALVFWVTVIIAGVLFFSSGGGIPGLKIDSQTASMAFWAIILLGSIYYVVSHKEQATENEQARGAGQRREGE
jgi:hypothetical protein